MTTLAEMQKELKQLRSEVRRIKGETTTRKKIAEAKFEKRKASFASLVGKFRSRGHSFAQAAKLASKEYKKARRKYDL